MAQLTKGWLRNNTTKEVKKFMYNPTNYSYSRSAVYSEVVSPLMNYPIVSYVGGTSNAYSINLMLYDSPFTGKITEFEEFLKEFLPPETNGLTVFVPPTVTIAMGHLVKKCVLEEMSVDIERYNSLGKPMVATITLSLKQVL